MFRARAHRQEGKLYYTVSGIITPIGGRPVHRLREDWMECMEFHPVQQNKRIIKFSASSWSVLINKYIEMHGQQNVKKMCYEMLHRTVKCCV